MTGWLPKEVLDHLDHAGYVAVPKERVKLLRVTEEVADRELAEMMHFSRLADFRAGQRSRVSMMMARQLLEDGFIDVQIGATSKSGHVENYAELYVVAPRTIKTRSEG